jgi:hypothetical protein
MSDLTPDQQRMIDAQTKIESKQAEDRLRARHLLNRPSRDWTAEDRAFMSAEIAEALKVE